MRTDIAKIALHKTHHGKLALDRRATFMLAVAGMLGIVARARPARAELRTPGTDATTTSRPSHNAIGGSGNPSATQFQNLRAVGPQGQVLAIHYRSKTFEITTADGRSTAYREANLRFKVDSSDEGPTAGRPVILPSGMMGDRVTLFFASPAEIGELVRS